jgi:hypothetical protein
VSHARIDVSHPGDDGANAGGRRGDVGGSVGTIHVEEGIVRESRGIVMSTTIATAPAPAASTAPSFVLALGLLPHGCAFIWCLVPYVRGVEEDE